MSTLKVGAIKGVSASSDAITINNDGTCTANLTNKSGSNLIINGAMRVAQRGTSSTADNYQTVDRFGCSSNGTDEAPTQAQVDVSSSDTPFTLGLTKAFKITNGNQTSGAGAADYMRIRHRIEAQDIRNSGWNYKSSSSYITLSFWVKSSVAQTFYLNVRSYDGTGQNYAHPFAATTSWTKITHSIPGNTNLDFANDAGIGLEFQWTMFYGTDYTNNTRTDNAWAAFDSNAQTKDHTSTWYTTNDATFEITGVQLEVGSVATDFDHKSFAQELTLCHRYCNAILQYGTGDTGSNRIYNHDYAGGNGFVVQSIPRMLAEPTITYSIANGTISTDYSSNDRIAMYDSGDNNFHIYDVLCEAEL